MNRDADFFFEDAGKKGGADAQFRCYFRDRNVFCIVFFDIANDLRGAQGEIGTRNASYW